MLLTCDLGEGLSDVDEQLMPYIDLASIACGGHAGDIYSMSRCIELAKTHRATIGAHPSYPDKENFGRTSMALSQEWLSQSILQQVTELHNLCAQQQCTLSYVKPHGALYNDMMQDLSIFSLIVKCIAEMQTCFSLPQLTLVVQALPDRSEHLRLANSYNVKLFFEAFADRRYQNSGALVPRSESLSVLQRNEDIIDQCKQILGGQVVTNTGEIINIDAQCLCLHSDNPHSVNSVSMLRNLLSSQVK